MAARRQPVRKQRKKKKKQNGNGNGRRRRQLVFNAGEYGVRNGGGPRKKDLALGATVLGAGVGYGIGAVSHTTKRNALYQQAMMQRAQGHEEGFKRTAKAHDAHLGHRKAYTRTGAVVGGVGAGALAAGLISWLALRKKLAARKIAREKEAVELAQLRERTERNRLRNERRAREREEKRVRDRAENAAKTPRSTKPAQKRWANIKSTPPKTVRTSGKTKRRRTRAQPTIVNPEAQVEQARTTREVFGLDGKSNREINQMITGVTRNSNHVVISVLQRPRTISHSPPPKWTALSAHGKRQRISLMAGNCIREAKTRTPNKDQLVIPYASIKFHASSSFCPPSLVVLKILSRIARVRIEGIPEQVKTEVKRVIDFA